MFVPSFPISTSKLRCSGGRNWQKDLDKGHADERMQSLPSTSSPRELVLMKNQGEKKLSAKVHSESILVVEHYG
jgi:hypothetical protein